jgi:hypothetical protein
LADVVVKSISGSVAILSDNGNVDFLILRLRICDLYSVCPTFAKKTVSNVIKAVIKVAQYNFVFIFFSDGYDDDDDDDD